MTDLIRLENDTLAVAVAPMGAELQSLRWKGRELLWQGDPAWWTGQAPLLFPIVGLAPDDKVAFGDDLYDMPKHGFARRSLFDLAGAGADFCRHILRDTPETRARFPFAFELAATHRIEGASLTQGVEITNRDARPIRWGARYFGQGGGSGATTVTLDNRAEPELARLVDGLLAPDRLASPFAAGRLQITPDLFRDDALIFPEGAGRGLTLGAETGPQLHFTFDNLPNLAIWQKVGAPFLCIEPWHGTAAAHGASPQMKERPWTVTLAPGDVARFSWTVTVQD